MKSAKKGSFYNDLKDKLEEGYQKLLGDESIDLSKIILSIRKSKELSAVSVCRAAGDLDPKTLNALEKGRIVNPSIKTLQSLSRGLNVSISSMFAQVEFQMPRHFSTGTAKGMFQMDFPSWGVKVISLTPFTKDFFCGKVILGGRRRLNETLFKHPRPLFVSALVGRFEVTVESKKLVMKEGDTLFFNAIMSHSFYNPLQRDAVFMLVTAPSFL